MRDCFSLESLIWDLFRSAYRPRRLAGRPQSTIVHYEVEIRHYCRYLDSLNEGDRPAQISDFTNSNLAGAMAWRAATASQATVNKLRRSILALWRFARTLIPDGIEMPNVAKAPEVVRSPTCWSIEELSRIMESARRVQGSVGDVPASLFWAALIGTVYDTGGRISAVMAAPRSHLDLDAGMILLQGENQKTNRDQWFELAGDTITDLRAMPIKSEQIFGCWPYDRTQVAWSALNQHFRRYILEPADLPTTRRDLWHKLRRTTATNVAIKHGITAAQDYLGHTDRSVTERYIDPTKLKRVVSAKTLPRPASSVLFLHRPDAG